MLLFNPEHDLCLANGDSNYVPPLSALKFGQDCAAIMEWIADKEKRITPWGWNPYIRKRLSLKGIPDEELPSSREIAQIRELSHRKVALEANEYIHNHIQSPYIERVDIIVAHDLSAIADILKKWHNAVAKAPLSGSGKGLRWLRDCEFSVQDAGWCKRTITRQGYVMVERRHRVIQDFAMLFHIGKDVSFEGYSLFFTDNATYKSNLLAPDHAIASILSSYFPNGPLEDIRDCLTCFLKMRFCGHYTGYTGVDMFVYDDGDGYRVQPCVEINVRMTMGLLARKVYDRIMTGDIPQGAAATDQELLSCLRGSNAAYPIMQVEYSPAPKALKSATDRAIYHLTNVTSSSNYAIAIFQGKANNRNV